MWLIQLITNKALRLNLSLVTLLLGEQNGHKRGIDLFFCPPHYARYNLRHLDPFYREAITAFSKFDLLLARPPSAKLLLQSYFLGPGV